MFTMMAYRHPPLYEQPDHAIWYYPLPMQAFVVALIVSLVAAVVNRWSKPRWAMLNVVLIAVVVEMSRSGGITNVNSAIRHGLGLSTRSRGCSSARSRTPGYMLFDRDTRVLRLLLASVGLPA
jgi:hypothetical protein